MDDLNIIDNLSPTRQAIGDSKRKWKRRRRRGKKTEFVFIWDLGTESFFYGAWEYFGLLGTPEKILVDQLVHKIIGTSMSNCIIWNHNWLFLFKKAMSPLFVVLLFHFLFFILFFLRTQLMKVEFKFKVLNSTLSDFRNLTK